MKLTKTNLLFALGGGVGLGLLTGNWMLAAFLFIASVLFKMAWHFAATKESN